MVNILVRVISLFALAALSAAVGIGPRRGTAADRDDDSPRSSVPAPAVAPHRSHVEITPLVTGPAAEVPRPRVGISPRIAAPAAGDSRPNVGISPRVTAPMVAQPGIDPGRITGFSPSAAGTVGIRRLEGVEAVPRRHFWHDFGGRRFCHFFDGRVHWYGYPFGVSFFWMRPFGGFWWTWDATFSRWVYWNDGFWWWPGPGGIQYVYVYDNYYPYSAVRQAAYAAPPAYPDEKGSWTSPDGRRFVEVSGPDAQATLFDMSGNLASYIAFLGKDVQKIRFAAASPGHPPTIAVEYRNGSVAVFDYDGRRLDAARPAAVKEAPPAGDIPPAPPGEPAPSGDLPAQPQYLTPSP